MWQLWKNYDIINKKYKGGNYMKKIYINFNNKYYTAKSCLL